LTVEHYGLVKPVVIHVDGQPRFRARLADETSWRWAECGQRSGVLGRGGGVLVSG
jgi:hypothetical protein